MRLRADYERAEIVTPDDYEWVPSPVEGVERMMLDRIGDEVAVATSLVRFAPGSSFPHHVHEKGEEFIVLEGTFSDASGDFPAPSYVRHPAGTEHAPWSEQGCLLFVKLRQFEDPDTAFVNVRPTADAVLHQHGGERVEWHAGKHDLTLDADPDSVTEIFVVGGTVRADSTALAPGTWLRTARDHPVTIESSDDAVWWQKRRPIGEPVD